jgi:hypothetical protein
MPSWESSKTQLLVYEKSSDILKSEDTIIEKAIARLEDCSKNKSYENRTSSLSYTFKYDGILFKNKGRYLSEFFLINNAQTLYPNENDFVTINVKSTPFSQEEYNKLCADLSDTEQGERVIFKNLFGRIFLSAYGETTYPFWVSPEPFHRDFGMEVGGSRPHDARWYEEGNYSFLFRERIGIIGREFNLFFGEKTYLKSQQFNQKNNRISLKKYFLNR